ncbi:MAG: extracellular solute-binding protein [Treponema sp.]|jgi:multiple sugar transport system substrate-binding protein|nr:extracellular solute-binding protein [Treponema sp.]
MKLYKKTFLLCMTLFLVAAVVFGNGKSDDATGKGVTIQFWNQWVGPDGDALVDIVNTFNRTNPWNIKVEMTIMNGIAEKLATSFPAGEASTLLLLNTGERFMYQEFLHQMDDIWTNTTLQESNFLRGYLEECRVDGKLYGLPFQNSSMFMYYNKDLFAKAGLDPNKPPMNFDEWTDMAKKITDHKSNVYGSGIFKSYYGQQMPLWEFAGGKIITEVSPGKYKVNLAGNAGYKKCLEWEKHLFDNGINPLEDDIDSMFRANQIGIMVNGAWLAAGADASSVNFEMAKIFGIEPVGRVEGFFISKNSTPDQILAAERFIQWWYQGNDGKDLAKTGGGRWAFEIGFPTGYIPLINAPEYKASKRLQALTVKNADVGTLMGAPASFRANTQVLEVIGNTSQEVIYGKPIDEALATAQKDIEAIVVQYHGQSALVR